MIPVNSIPAAIVGGLATVAVVGVVYKIIRGTGEFMGKALNGYF